jgi:hypothetical protein
MPDISGSKKMRKLLRLRGAFLKYDHSHNAAASVTEIEIIAVTKTA